MENVRDALLRMVRAAKDANFQMDFYKRVGIGTDRIFNIYGNIADAIYCLIGEKTENFDESITNLALTTPYLSDSRRAEILYSAYKNNVLLGNEPMTVQPKPYTISDEEFRKLARDHGYYAMEVGERL